MNLNYGLLISGFNSTIDLLSNLHANFPRWNCENESKKEPRVRLMQKNR